MSGFQAGATVEFKDGRRIATGSVLTVDEEAGELALLDLGTNIVVRRKPSQVRMVKAAPVVVRRRTEASNDTEAATEAESAAQPTWSTADVAEAAAPVTYRDARSAAEALFAPKTPANDPDAPQLEVVTSTPAAEAQTFAPVSSGDGVTP